MSEATPSIQDREINRSQMKVTDEVAVEIRRHPGGIVIGRFERRGRLDQIDTDQQATARGQ